LAPGGRTTSRVMSNPLLNSYSSCFVFTKHPVQLKTVTTCYQNMFFTKRAPKQKGGCLDTLDTPWICHWTSQSASSTSDAGRRVASVQKHFTANQRSQNAYITQPALFSVHNRIRAPDQTSVELLRSLQFTAPCGGSDVSQTMPDKQYATSLCKLRYSREQSRKASSSTSSSKERERRGMGGKGREGKG